MFANLPVALYLITVGILALVVLQVLNLAYTVDQSKTARRLLEMEQTLTRQHDAAATVVGLDEPVEPIDIEELRQATAQLRRLTGTPDPTDKDAA